ncbi:hypothetical protein ACJX0J_016902, partial [Zea mays]
TASESFEGWKLYCFFNTTSIDFHAFMLMTLATTFNLLSTHTRCAVNMVTKILDIETKGFIAPLLFLQIVYNFHGRTRIYRCLRVFSNNHT